MSRSTRTLSRRAGRWFAAALASSLSVTSLGLMTAAGANAGDPPGTIRSAAGSVVNFAQFGFSGDGGPATQAQLYNPRAVAFGPGGVVYIADALNERVRKVDANGVISTFAGKGPSDTSAGLQDGATPTGPDGDGGPATQAVFNQPHGVAVDSKGNVYIADSNDNRIRKVDIASGNISTRSPGPAIPTRRRG